MDFPEPGASGHGAYPGEEFGGGEGLHELVVGPHFEAPETLIEGVGRGDEDNRLRERWLLL